MLRGQIRHFFRWFRNPLPIVRDISVIVAIAGFILNLHYSRLQGDAEAWGLLSAHNSGNSGKVEALEYLNEPHPLAVPNPRHWGIPVGPVDANGTPEDWVLVEDFGPWRPRSPLTGIDLSPHAPVQTYLEHVQLPGAQLFNANLSNTDLAGANLYGASLIQAKLSGATLNCANVRSVLICADLRKANLTLAQLDQAQMQDVLLAGSNLQGANLTSANLLEADAHGANFDGAKLVNAQMVNANFTAASFRDADLRGADLLGANFTDAVLNGANLAGASLTGTDRINPIRGLTQEQLDQACTDRTTVVPANLLAPGPCVLGPSGIERDKNGLPVHFFAKPVVAEADGKSAK